MKTNVSTEIPEQLAEQLVHLSADKQAEILVQWTWQMAVELQRSRNAHRNTILAGLFGIAGVLLGVGITVVCKHLL